MGPRDAGKNDAELSKVIRPDPKAKVPAHLFKYRSLAEPTWVRDLIVNQRLYFPAAADLNDPFDCKPHVVTTATSDQRADYIRRFVSNTMSDKSRPERRRFERQILNNPRQFMEAMKLSHANTMAALGVYSLSAESLDLLMWPHYANEHRGICVRFSMAELLNENDVPLPVTYASHRPVANPIVEEPEAATMKSILTKGITWAYEKEWRIVRDRGGRQVVQPQRSVIDGVILGARISIEDRKMVLGWVNEARRPMEVYQAGVDASEYALAVHQVVSAGGAVENG